MNHASHALVIFLAIKLDSGDLSPEWPDWIITQTLLREAKALLGDDAKTGDPNK